MDKVEEKWLMIDNQVIYYYIKRKKIKNMYMRISKDGKLTITTSNSCSQEKIENFIKQKQEWVIKQLEIQNELKHDKENDILKDDDFLYFLGDRFQVKIVTGKENNVEVEDLYIVITIKERYIDNNDYVRRVYEQWLKEQCLAVTKEYIDIYYEKMKEYKIPYPEIGVKNFKSRWGCCTPKKCKVEFALNLVKTPLMCIEYVVVHELAHFKYINHNKDFYNFVSIFLPDWKKKRDCLNKDFGRIIV